MPHDIFGEDNVGGGGPTVVFTTPEQFGAARNGVTDDTSAIKQALASAVSQCQANGTYYAEVWFSAGTYFIGGSLDTSQMGRAQIPLPYIAGQPSNAVNTPKVTLVLRGVSDASAFPLWYQSVPQKGGAVLLSNLSASYSPTFGAASVLAGPTKEGLVNAGVNGNNLNVFSNMLIVIDGLVVMSNYTNPLHGAVDLAQVAQANVKTLAISGDIVPPNFANPTAGGFGLRMPQVGNNDYCKIGSLSVQGYTVGFVPGEHTDAERVGVIYCQYGVCVPTTPDSMRINYLSTEICQFHLDTTQEGGSIPTWQNRIDIGTWDVEDGDTTNHVNDPNNWLYGTVSNWKRNEGGSASDFGPIVNGGANLKIIATGGTTVGHSFGHVTAPSVPATTVVLQNPFWRDAAVTVSSGTVTAITVDGTAVGITSGTVIVPSGKTIALTYTGTPVWVWNLL